MNSFIQAGIFWGSSIGILAGSFFLNKNRFGNLSFLEKSILVGLIIFPYAAEGGVLAGVVGLCVAIFGKSFYYLNRYALWLVHIVGGTTFLYFGLHWFTGQPRLIHSPKDSFVPVKKKVKATSIKHFPSKSTELKTKVFLIGLDGADLTMINPFLKAGKLPNFSRLIQNGVCAPLRTIMPTSTPVIWTTIATGKSPDKHGILNWLIMKIPGIRPIPGYITELEFPKGAGLRTFFKQLERLHIIKSIPSGSSTRRCKAIWNILSEAQYKVGFVGWLCTWPAETINRFLISQYAFPYELIIGKPILSFPQRTYPEELMEELKTAVVDKAKAKKESEKQLGIPAQLLPEKYFPWNFAKDETFRQMSHALLNKYPDLNLFGVYFSGIDASCHHWWSFSSDGPAAYSERNNILSDFKIKPTPEFQSILNNIIERYYTYMDHTIGEFLKFVSEDDLIVIVSDHGFKFDGTQHRNAPDGIIILSGKMVKTDSAFQQPPTIFDITPTILWVLGLPVAEDMDGRVLKEVFASSWVSKHPVKTIQTYEEGYRISHAKRAFETDEGLKERLRSLGYI